MQRVGDDLLRLIFTWTYEDARAGVTATSVRLVCKRFDAAVRGGPRQRRWARVYDWAGLSRIHTGTPVTELLINLIADEHGPFDIRVSKRRTVHRPILRGRPDALEHLCLRVRATECEYDPAGTLPAILWTWLTHGGGLPAGLRSVHLHLAMDAHDAWRTDFLVPLLERAGALLRDLVVDNDERWPPAVCGMGAHRLVLRLKNPWPLDVSRLAGPWRQLTWTDTQGMVGALQPFPVDRVPPPVECLGCVEDLRLELNADNWRGWGEQILRLAARLQRLDIDLGPTDLAPLCTMLTAPDVVVVPEWTLRFRLRGADDRDVLERLLVARAGAGPGRRTSLSVVATDLVRPPTITLAFDRLTLQGPGGAAWFSVAAVELTTIGFAGYTVGRDTRVLRVDMRGARPGALTSQLLGVGTDEGTFPNLEEIHLQCEVHELIDYRHSDVGDLRAKGHSRELLGGMQRWFRRCPALRRCSLDVHHTWRKYDYIERDECDHALAFFGALLGACGRHRGLRVHIRLPHGSTPPSRVTSVLAGRTPESMCVSWDEVPVGDWHGPACAEDWTDGERFTSTRCVTSVLPRRRH